MKPCKWCGFSVEQPREIIPFAEIQLKEIQTLDRIVRFLVVPQNESRSDVALVFVLCVQRVRRRVWVKGSLRWIGPG